MSGARDAQSERLSKTSFSLKRVEVEEKGLNDRDQHNDLSDDVEVEATSGV